MNHIEEGAVVSIRDGGWAPAEARSHAESCAACGSAVAEAAERAAQIERMLETLELPDIDLEEARARIRARMDERLEPRSAAGARRWPSHLGRAAAVILVAAGAVSALPGSPVRNWITGPEQAVETVPPVGTAETQDAETTGVAVTVPAGGIRVLINSLGPLGRLEVVWIDQATARVDAPAGSRFTYGEGRVEAMVAGGPVRVELPRTGGAVSLEVDGQPYLTRSGEELDVTGPVRQRSDARILFDTP